MEATLASAMVKLTKTEHPIAALLHKHQMQSLNAEIVRLQRVVDEGEIIFSHPSPLQPPNWAPILGRLILFPLNWLRRMYGRLSLTRQHPVQEKQREEVAQVRTEIEGLQAKQLTGILTPLTVQEEYEIDAHYYAVYRQLKASFPVDDTTPEQRAAQDEAIDFTSSHAHRAKQLQVALKKSELKDGHQVLVQPLVRALTEKQAMKIDPRLVMEIWDEYKANFELTESELGK